MDGIGYDILGFIEDWMEGIWGVFNGHIKNIKLSKLMIPLVMLIHDICLAND